MTDKNEGKDLNWIADHFDVCRSDGDVLFETPVPSQARFIVKACNNHYELFEALKTSTKTLDDSLAGNDLEEGVREAISDQIDINRKLITKVERIK